MLYFCVQFLVMTIAIQKKLVFPVSVVRMLFVAILNFFLLIISMPADAQAVSSSDSQDSLFFTRAGALTHTSREFTADFQKDDRLFVVAKTNLLFDLATALNVEIEFPMFNHCSLLCEYVFPWWEFGNKYCFQMLEFGPEVRFWFDGWESDSRDKMQGWFAGIYGMSAMYDFQYDKKLCYQGEYFSVGLSGGYVHQMKKLFGKPTSARLEFSLAAGFLQTDFRHYLPTDDYSVLIRDKYNVGRVSYFGPTKAKVSLVIPVFINNDKFRR